MSSGYDRLPRNPDSPDELAPTARLAQFSASTKLMPMDERHVVTAFLTRGNQVLLLRRTDRVSTYKGRWAGVSGSVEAGSTPIEQAIQEIEEETGLSNADAIPILAGQSLDFVDDALNRRWVVHPFRFRVSDEAKIRLDWEHSEARWIEPAQLERMSTVPRLFDAWLRVGIPARLDRAVARRNPRGSFLRSRRTGPPSSRPTRQRLLEQVRDTARHMTWTTSLDRTAGALRLVRPTMAPIAYWAGRFEANLAGIEENEQALSLPALRSADRNVGVRNLENRGGPTESSPRGRCRRLLDGRRCSRHRQLQLFPGRGFQAGRRARKKNPSIGARVRRRSALVWPASRRCRAFGRLERHSRAG